MIRPDFWAGRRVLLTGHTGFKGSWLSLWLAKLGANVSGYALQAPTEPSMFDLANVASVLENSVVGDVRDLTALSGFVSETSPEIVIHMAAQSLVRESYLNPVDTYSTNVMGTVNLLEAVRTSSSVKAILVVTSDKCYENEELGQRYREDAAMGGHDPYSSSKGCAELVSAAYRRSFLEAAEIALATARAGNVIGGGDWADDRIVPDAIRAFITGTPLQVRNPTAVRPWQHVLEPLAGYLLLCQNLVTQPKSYSESWNFGPDQRDEQAVSVIVSEMAKDWGGEAEWQTSSKKSPHEAHFLTLDSSQANSVLGWNPAWRLDRALHETVLWYQAWSRGENMHSFSMSQISSFQSEFE